MAETKTRSTRSTSRSSANRSTSRRSTSRRTTSGGSTQRKAAATRRSTSAKRAATTRNARATSRNTKRATTRTQSEIAREATAARRDAEKTLNKVVGGAERVALTYVGATLTARDRVTELVTTYSKRTQVERRLKAFERRGTTARNRVERELKKRRTRLEREVRTRSGRVERDLKTLRGDVANGNVTKLGRDVQRTGVAQNISLGREVVENAAQGAALAATKAAREVTGRVAQLV